MTTARRVSVLVVDDAQDTREMYAEYLAFKGYDVDTAPNGRIGLEEAFRRPPDVVVLDLTMPGVDGLDVIRTLRAFPPTSNVFIIVVTGHALKGVETQVKNAGGDRFLSKPCLPEDLEAAIRNRAGRRPKTRR